VSGNKIGRSLGFPTANIVPNFSEKMIPNYGVYAVNVFVNHIKFGGMLNIGTRPTLDFANNLSIEVYIFDFNEDIYGQEIRLEFLKFIRPEKKFENLDDLRAQLRLDMSRIKSTIPL